METTAQSITLFPSGGPDTPPPNCAYGPNGTELTIFGDSRAWFLSTGATYPLQRAAVSINKTQGTANYGQPDGTINGATSPVSGQLLIADGEITSGFTQNLGWPGATASDSEKLNAPVELLLGLAIWAIIGAFSSLGPLGALLGLVSGYFILDDLQTNFHKLYDAIFSMPVGNNWNRRLTECILTYGLPYRSSNKTVISIGGNDMINFYKYMEGYEGYYFFLRVITHPQKYLESLLYGKGFINKFSKEAFWFWQFEVKENAIVNETKSLIQYHLDNLVIPPYTQANQVMLLSVAPTISMGAGRDFAWEGKLKDWIRLTFYLRRLRDKYQWEIMPAFTNPKYAGRVHFLDMYDRFLNNILFEWGSYYWFGDGIHFTSAGNEQFGRMIAAKAVQIGWFRKNPAVDDGIINTIVSGQIVNPNDYCSSGSPDKCTNEISCTSAGNNWCSSYCSTNACPVATTPPPPDPLALLLLCFVTGICNL